MIDLIYYILSFMGTHFHSLTNQFLIIKLIFHETWNIYIRRLSFFIIDFKVINNLFKIIYVENVISIIHKQACFLPILSAQIW